MCTAAAASICLLICDEELSTWARTFAVHRSSVGLELLYVLLVLCPCVATDGDERERHGRRGGEREKRGRGEVASGGMV
jgi:hypothetical protein